MSLALPFQTAKQLAAAVRKKKIGCLELLEIAVERQALAQGGMAAPHHDRRPVRTDLLAPHAVGQRQGDVDGDGQDELVVVTHDAGAIFANASLEMWSSTPSLQNITIEHGFRRGVALQWDAFVEDRADQSEIACDYWTYDDVISEFTFSDICINQSEIPVADCPLLDFRVFLSTDAEYCAD